MITTTISTCDPVDLAGPVSEISPYLWILRKIRCVVHMRGWTSSVPEISVSPTRMSVSGLEILPYEHFSPVTRMKAGWILEARMASSCFACCIFQIINIPFNCSNTAITVAKAMIGTKVIIFWFGHVWLCFSNFGPGLVPRIFSLFSSRKQGWSSSYEPCKAKLDLVTGPARGSTWLMWRGPLRQETKFPKMVWANLVS